jgi:hypothetical protein
MEVTGKRFGPDHTEIVLATGADERIVAWHWELLHWIKLQVDATGAPAYFVFGKQCGDRVGEVLEPTCPVSALTRTLPE